MTVQELIDKLQQMPNKGVRVSVRYQGSGGCSTCGWGGEVEATITDAYDHEVRVELSI